MADAPVARITVIRRNVEGLRSGKGRDAEEMPANMFDGNAIVVVLLRPEGPPHTVQEELTCIIWIDICHFLCVQ